MPKNSSTPARRAASALAASVIAAAGTHLHAGDLFIFSLTETGNPDNTLTVGGNTIPDLASDLADQAGRFESFDGLPFSAAINYAGIEDAIRINFDPSGGATGGRLLIIENLLGTDETFTFDEADGDLGDKLEDFFVKDNPRTIADFLKAASQQSLVAVTDGNPLATTARSADYKFRRHGLYSTFSMTPWHLRSAYGAVPRPADDQDETNAGNTDPTGGLRDSTLRSRWRSRIDFQAHTVDAGGFSGSSFSLDTSLEARLTNNISIVFGFPISYHEIEGADVVNLGTHLDIPLRIITPHDEEDFGFTWAITPGGSVDLVGSFDYAAGGMLYSVGVNNRFTYDMPKWSFTLSQQITAHEGTRLSYSGYSFDPGVSQQILKLGAQTTYQFADNFFAYGAFTYSDFLQDAAVDNYVTPAGGLGLRFRNGAHLAAGYEGDFASDFERHGLRVFVHLPF